MNRSPAHRSRAFSHLLLAGAAVALLVVTARALPVDTGLAALREWVGAHGALGMIAFGAAHVVLALLLVPGAALTLIGGAVFGLGWGVTLVAIAMSVADAVAFLLARHVARDAIERLMARYPRFKAFDQAMDQGGWRIVALLRLNPTIPYSASNYLFGVTGVAFLPYLLASGVFTLPGAFAYVYLGCLGAETLGGRSRTPAEWTRAPRDDRRDRICDGAGAARARRVGSARCERWSTALTGARVIACPPAGL